MLAGVANSLKLSLSYTVFLGKNDYGCPPSQLVCSFDLNESKLCNQIGTVAISDLPCLPNNHCNPVFNLKCYGMLKSIDTGMTNMKLCGEPELTSSSAELVFLEKSLPEPHPAVIQVHSNTHSNANNYEGLSDANTNPEVAQPEKTHGENTADTADAPSFFSADAPCFSPDVPCFSPDAPSTADSTDASSHSPADNPPTIGPKRKRSDSLPDAPSADTPRLQKSALSKKQAKKPLSSNFKKNKHSTRTSLKPSQSLELNAKKQKLISECYASELVEHACLEQL